MGQCLCRKAEALPHYLKKQRTIKASVLVVSNASWNNEHSVGNNSGGILLLTADAVYKCYILGCALSLCLCFGEHLSMYTPAFESQCPWTLGHIYETWTMAICIKSKSTFWIRFSGSRQWEWKVYIDKKKLNHSNKITISAWIFKIKSMK